jgi:hypothetical protein
VHECTVSSVRNVISVWAIVRSALARSSIHNPPSRAVESTPPFGCDIAAEISKRSSCDCAFFVLFSKCIFDTWVTSAHCSIVRIPTPVRGYGRASGNARCYIDQ